MGSESWISSSSFSDSLPLAPALSLALGMVVGWCLAFGEDGMANMSASIGGVWIFAGGSEGVVRRVVATLALG